MPDPRPHLSPALDALLAHAVEHVDAFRHVRAEQVLVVGGAALKHSRATIRGFPDGQAPIIKVGTRRIRYEITLRPLFLLQANGLGRLCTLFHELFHIGPLADGALDPSRRHGAPGGDFDAVVERLARRYAKTAPPDLLAPLGHHGEVLLQQWRVRPGNADHARVYGEKHLFTGPVAMRTPRGQRTVWW
jgi:hypothetical protein